MGNRPLRISSKNGICLNIFQIFWTLNFIKCSSLFIEVWRLLCYLICLENSRTNCNKNFNFDNSNYFIIYFLKLTLILRHSTRKVYSYQKQHMIVNLRYLDVYLMTLRLHMYFVNLCRHEIYFKVYLVKQCCFFSNNSCTIN